MADRIKGITIEIDGETTGLQESLKDVNKQSFALQNELRQVDRLLKFSPDSTTALAQKQELLSKQIENTSQKLQGLKSAQSQVEEQFKSGKIGEEQYRAFQREIQFTEASLNKFKTTYKDAMTPPTDDIAQPIKELGKNVEESNSKLGEFGNTAKVAVVGGMVAVGAAIVGVGAAAINLGDDYQKASNTLQTQTGATAEEMDILNQAMTNVYGNNFGESMQDVAESMAMVQTYLKGTGEDVQKVTENAFAFKDTFGVEVPESIRAVKAMMSQFGITSEEAFNLMAQGQQEGLNFSDELIDSIAEYSVKFGDAGFSAEQMFEVMKAGVDGGAFALDQIGDAVKEMTIILTDGSANEALTSLGLNADEVARNIASGGEGTTKVFNDIFNAVSSIEDPLEKQNMLITLFGTLTEDLGGEATLAMMNLGNTFDKTKNTMEQINKVKYNTPLEAIAGLGRQLETSVLLPIAQNVMPALNDMVAKLQETFANSNVQAGMQSLSDGISNIAIGFADFVAYILPGLLTGLGWIMENASAIAIGIISIGTAIKTLEVASTVMKLANSFKTTQLAISGVASAGSIAGGATGLGALATGLGGAIVAAAPFIAAAGAIALAGYGIYKGLTQEVVPSVDLFADKVQYTSTTAANSYGQMATTLQGETIKIADSTKQAVKSYMDMDEGAKSHLQDLYINGQVITDEITNSTKSKFDAMKTSIVQGYETQKTDSLAKLQEMFGKQNEITSQEQSQILQKTTDFYTNKQTQTQTYEDQINAIIKTASDQKRTLTQQEVTDIGQLQNQMRENAINSLSQNEVEAQVILQRMKDYDGRITAEQASEHIKKLNESRDGAVAAAEDEYNKNIATITKMRDETGAITTEQADKMISEAKRQRDEVVQHAEDTRTNAVEKIKGMNSDLENSVDTSTGKILTWWDKLKNWWNSWQPKPKTVEITTETQAAGNAFKNATNQNMGNGTIWGGVDENWTGNESFAGGLTTLHERGYEVYNLPTGTKIWNHDASEDLVLKTAESVATKVANNIARNYNVGSSQPIKIEVPVILDGTEVARVITPYIDNNLAFQMNRG